MAGLESRLLLLLLLLLLLPLLLLLLHRFPWLLRLLQHLYQLGFRLISHEVNMTVKTQASTAGYHSYLEVVLMRDTVWAYLDGL